MVARGSSRVYLAKLPDRISTGRGQGGGGPLSIEELEVVLKAHSDNPVLFAESTLHIDSAKAYSRNDPMKWRRSGAHVFAFEGTLPFSQFHYAHCVS